MSAASRWIVAVFCLVWAGIFMAMPYTLPESGLSLAKCLMLAGPLVVIALACARGPLQKIAVRLIGAGVFAGWVAYVVSEVGNPMLDIWHYRKSDANLVNACLAMFFFGIPAAYVAATGRFPTWTKLGDSLHPKGTDVDSE